MLTIDGLAVPVAFSTTYVIEQDGQLTRAFSGRMRNDVAGRFRVIAVQTPELSVSELSALRAKLDQPGPLPCSGDLVGTPADFHAGPYRVEPISATDWRVSFELFKTEYE